MSDKPTANEMMEAYALDAVDHAKSVGVHLDFSSASMEKVEGILASMFDARPKGFFARLFKRGPSPKVIYQFAQMYGGYVGEVLRRKAGGEWFLDSETAPGNQMIALGNAPPDDHWGHPPRLLRRRVRAGADGGCADRGEDRAVRIPGASPRDHPGVRRHPEAAARRRQRRRQGSPADGAHDPGDEGRGGSGSSHRSSQRARGSRRPGRLRPSRPSTTATRGARARRS